MTPAANGSGKTLMAVVGSVLSALFLAGLFGLMAMWQRTVLQEERHQAMRQIDQIQSTNIQALTRGHDDLQRLVELLRERQALNIKAVESLSALVGSLTTRDAEQQYQLNALMERVRLLESRPRAEGP